MVVLTKTIQNIYFFIWNEEILEEKLPWKLNNWNKINVSLSTEFTNTQIKKI